MILVIYYAIVIIAVLLDLYTKELVLGSEALMSGGSIDLIPGVLRFRYTYNEGAAMGMLTDNRWVFMIMSTVAIVALIIGIAVVGRKMSVLCGVSLSMITGGGIGNMVERIFNGDVLGKGKVTDFIDFYAFPEVWPWIFNVADICVCVGVAIFIFDYIYTEVKLAKEKKCAAAALATDSEVTTDSEITTDPEASTDGSGENTESEKAVSDGDLPFEESDAQSDEPCEEPSGDSVSDDEATHPDEEATDDNEEGFEETES